MKYYRVDISFIPSPEKLNRMMLIRSDLSMFEIGVAILSSLKSEFNHMFLFKDMDYTYVDNSWLDGYDDYRDYNNYYLNNLNMYDGNTLILEYDTGSTYEFEINVIEEVEVENTLPFFNLEGKGYIWEDNLEGLIDYLSGGELEDKYKDFEDKIDFDLLNIVSFELYKRIIENFDDDLENEDRMDSLLEDIIKFNKERDWDKFHTEENLAKSISIEANELLECYQWDNKPELDDVYEELADVLSYAFMMAIKIGVDPIEIVRYKMKKNAEKYPVSKCKGKSTKYNKL